MYEIYIYYVNAYIYEEFYTIDYLLESEANLRRKRMGIVEK